MVDIVETPIDIAAWIASVHTVADGAVTVFLGTVRENSNGRRVARMEYHCYRELAMREMAALEEAANRLWPAARVALVHRIGSMTTGETSVAIVVVSPHREEAFAACRFLIDELKRTVPIWKKEYFGDGESAWVQGIPGRSANDHHLSAPHEASDGDRGMAKETTA